MRLSPMELDGERPHGKVLPDFTSLAPGLGKFTHENASLTQE
jgi:hypothetical protein